MKPVARLRNRRIGHVLRTVALLTLSVILALMLRSVFEPAPAVKSSPSRVEPSRDHHLDPFLPVQWLDVFADRA